MHPNIYRIAATILCGSTAALHCADVAVTGASAGPEVTLRIQVDRLGPRLNPGMWGIFFEDINFAGDGGLYPERVKNRSFEFTEPLMGWRTYPEDGTGGEVAVLQERPLNPNNPRYLRVRLDEGNKAFGLSNEGFFGMGVERAARFTFSVFGRAPEGGSPELTAELVDPAGRSLGRTTLRGFGADWKQHRGTVRAKATEPKARLNVFLTAPGMLEIDMVSLFPKDTWNQRANGLRPDLVQWLADLNPGFLRFPGGCIVEGRHLATRYQWKTTIGDLEERKLIINRWNDEFKHRPAPDYFQSFGLGFFEYFQLAEDLGAEPMPILNCGMACQFNSGELTPLRELVPFIEDALDLIEFANGPTTSTWGKRRAALGHPRPFNLRLLGVGNEQWGPQYLERYARFAEVLQARHQEVKLIASAGPRPDDELFHFLWPKLRELKADIIDEHCYAGPDWFFNNAGRYDAYDRNGPRVFMGEFAAQSVRVASPDNRNNWECALAEAAYMTGLERNGDVVKLSSYAPLSGHVEGWQWTPNLIWFDNLRSFATPNYYVQQLFGTHHGTRLLPFEFSTPNNPTNLYASVVFEESAHEVIVKLVNAAAAPRIVRLESAGFHAWAPKGKAVVLASDDLKAENSMEHPTRVAPVTRELRGIPPVLRYELEPYSMTVLRLKANRER
jgi:alpha-L-arabinofuranosidase